MSVHDLDNGPTLYLGGVARRNRAYYESAALLIVLGIVLLIDGIDRLLTSTPTRGFLQPLTTTSVLPTVVPWLGALFELLAAIGLLALALPALILAVHVPRLCEFWARVHPALALLFLIARVANAALRHGTVPRRRIFTLLALLATTLLRICVLASAAGLLKRLNRATTPASQSATSARRAAMLSFACVAVASSCALAVGFDAYLNSQGKVLVPLLTFFAALLLMVAAAAGVLVAYSGDVHATRVVVATCVPVAVISIGILAVVHPALDGRGPHHVPFMDVASAPLAALLTVAALAGPYCLVRAVEDQTTKNVPECPPFLATSALSSSSVSPEGSTPRDPKLLSKHGASSTGGPADAA